MAVKESPSLIGSFGASTVTSYSGFLYSSTRNEAEPLGLLAMDPVLSELCVGGQFELPGTGQRFGIHLQGSFQRLSRRAEREPLRNIPCSPSDAAHRRRGVRRYSGECHGVAGLVNRTVRNEESCADGPGSGKHAIFHEFPKLQPGRNVPCPRLTRKPSAHLDICPAPESLHNHWGLW